MDWHEDQEVQKFLTSFQEQQYEARIEEDPNDGWNWWVTSLRFNEPQQAQGSEATLAHAQDAVEATVARWEGYQAGTFLRGARGVLEDVRDFHAIMGVPVREVPGFPADERVDLRIDLIKEEWEKEALPAIQRRDLVEAADGLVDLIYVIAGTMLEFGIPAAAWDEVQRSNMAKRDPKTGKVRYRQDGKVLKPDGWTGPDIKNVLLEHGWHQ